VQNGWLAVDAVKKSVADGYTFLQVDNTHVSLQQHLFKKIPFDFNKDFEPATPLYWTNFFIVVPINSKWNTVTDLINAAKEKSGALTFASWGVGSAGHVGAAMFEADINTQMNHVPYKDLPSVYNAVANGEVDWAFGTAASAGPLYPSEKGEVLSNRRTKETCWLFGCPNCF
jgi:tripartite-type tricarboxylate transporter receptor subunit TctC